MQIWAESGKSALPICNYSQILYQFLTFTQNLKRSRFFVTLVTKNSAYQFMLPSLLHMGFDNHYNCVDEHDYNQRMQILLPFDRVFPLL